MVLKKNNLFRIATLIFFGISFALIVHFMGLLDFIPRLRASAQSPDGNLSVYVYEKRLFPRPIFPSMGAIAKVYDNQGNLIFDEIIYHDDDWDDTVGDAYNKISFHGDEIHISPGAYNPNKSYVITRSTLGKK